MEKRKTKAMGIKHYKDKRRINLSSKKDGNHKSDTRDNTGLN